MSSTSVARAPVTIVPSVCPHDCTSTCALDVERLDERTIGRVRGSQRNPYTAGVICEKVARYAERIHHPDRLLHPLKRNGPKGSRQFRPISWEQALDEIAGQFIAKAQAHGSETVWPYFYAGTMGLVQRDGINRLRHVMRYSRWFSTICVALSDNGWIAGTGAKRGVDLREAAEHSDLIVIWGGNPVNTQVNVMTHAMAAKKRGAPLVVIDPYRTGTAERADLHLAVRPGTDGALACAVMHVLFAEGFADWDYLRQHTDAPDELAAHLKSRTPAWAAEITGLPAEQILQFARMYGRAKAPFIRAHHGFSRQRNGAVNMHAVSCLPAVKGAWRHPGGGAIGHVHDVALLGLGQRGQVLHHLLPHRQRLGEAAALVLVHEPGQRQAGRAWPVLAQLVDQRAGFGELREVGVRPRQVALHLRHVGARLQHHIADPQHVARVAQRPVGIGHLHQVHAVVGEDVQAAPQLLGGFGVVALGLLRR